MANKAKHAFGQSSGIEAAKQAKKIDAFDILFLDGETDPKIGWLDSQGNTVIVPNKTDLSGVEAELATKVGTAEVDEKINTAVINSVATAKAYTDGKVEAAISEHMTKKYEITDVPEGTLVKMSDSEIRVMCPSDAVFTKQSVGAGGDANCYYMTLKTYVYDDNVVGYREHLGNQVDAEILTDLKTDEYGRRYQPTWLPLAKYDEATDVWTYYGKNSTNEKYIGWDYQIDWYDANGVMIASDSIRINLSNEGCHSEIKPYYVGDMVKTANAYTDAQIDAKIAEAVGTIEVVEF